MLMKTISNQTYEQERALYHTVDALVTNCRFIGPADGESALKESHNFKVDQCLFALRYPLWHARNFELLNSEFSNTSRAPLWYCEQGKIDNVKIYGVKALRECSHIDITNSYFESEEFGWKCRDIKMSNSKVEAFYLFLESKNIELDHFELKGKYSFQYVENLNIKDSYLDTKDAFWHSKNVTVKDTVIKGEYLAWFSDGLTLINCKIIGIQPFCYCKNLKLINCEMIDCDLSFEYSDVDAVVKGHVDSIKNPRSGKIVVDSVGEIIKIDPVMECNAEIVINNK